MKKIILILMAGICFSQTYEDVVILKNGSEIHGIIIEQKPNEYIKIQSGKNIFVYQMDEIELIKKELIDISINNVAKKSDIANNTWSAGVGLGTNKSFNLLQITKDFKLGKKMQFLLYAGYPNIFGIGFASQSNYNEKGLIAAVNYGIDYEGYGTGSLSVAYQWRLNNANSFFSLGLSVWTYTIEDYWGTCEYCYDYIVMTLPVTVISYDVRF